MSLAPKSPPSPSCPRRPQHQPPTQRGGRPQGTEGWGGGGGGVRVGDLEGGEVEAVEAHELWEHLDLAREDERVALPDHAPRLQDPELAARLVLRGAARRRAGLDVGDEGGAQVGEAGLGDGLGEEAAAAGDPQVDQVGFDVVRRPRLHAAALEEHRGDDDNVGHAGQEHWQADLAHLEEAQDVVGVVGGRLVDGVELGRVEARGDEVGARPDGRHGPAQDH